MADKLITQLNSVATLADDEARSVRKALEAQLAQAKQEAAKVATTYRSQIMEHSAKVQSE